MKKLNGKSMPIIAQYLLHCPGVEVLVHNALQSLCTGFKCTRDRNVSPYYSCEAYQYKVQMYYFKLVHCGVVVMTRALHQSGPGSIQFPPLVISIIPWWGGIASVPALSTEKWKACWCWVISHQKAQYLFDLVPVDLVVSLNGNSPMEKQRE